MNFVPWLPKLKCMEHSKRLLVMIGNASNGLRVHYAVIVMLYNRYFQSGQLWAERIGRPCGIEDARTLNVKCVCKNRFLESEFTTPERKHLNRGAVPCTSDSASWDPTPQVPDSPWLMDLNSSPSVLSPQKNLHIQPLKRTYSKLCMPSLSVQTPLPIHIDSSSHESLQSVPHQQQPTHCSWRHFLSPNLKCFWWGIQAHQLSNSFSKPRARHFLLRELNLATVSQFTPSQKFLYGRSQNKESALCKLR
jgi:hypothetical protein